MGLVINVAFCSFEAHRCLVDTKTVLSQFKTQKELYYFVEMQMCSVVLLMDTEVRRLKNRWFLLNILAIYMTCRTQCGGTEVVG